LSAVLAALRERQRRIHFRAATSIVKGAPPCQPSNKNFVQSAAVRDLISPRRAGTDQAGAISTAMSIGLDRTANRTEVHFLC